MTVRCGLSSMKMFASPSLVIARLTFCQSRSPSWPVRMRWASTRASEASRRWESSRWLISRLNRSAGLRSIAPTWVRIPSAKLVLPIDGRAPTIVRLEGCRPSRMLSRSVNPVAVPVMCPLPRSSIQSTDSCRSSPRDRTVSALRRSATSRIICSAESMTARDVVGRAVGEVGDLPARPDEAPQDGELLDDAGVVGRVRRRRGVGLQRDERGGVRAHRHQPCAVELVGDRDGVGGLPGLVEPGDRGEDLPVGRLVEVVRCSAARCRWRSRRSTAASHRAATPRRGGCAAGPLARHRVDGGGRGVCRRRLEP